MRAVKSKDTKPELELRRLVHRLGFRFRLHRADLPGTPDLAFPRLKKVIFMHGCFWHGHSCTRGGRTPKNNRDYWVRKIARNQERDALSLGRLKSLGWKTLTVWECELRQNPKLAEHRVTRFLLRPPARDAKKARNP
jgi:DNA mismatch endonuclease (patch repair protein)